MQSNRIAAVIHYEAKGGEQSIDVFWTGILRNEIRLLRLFGHSFYIEWLDTTNGRA